MPQYEVVFTTDPKDCPRCHRSPCKCPPASSGKPLAGQTAKIRLEKGGRKGKTVTVVFNLNADAARLKDLLRDLQKACGTGGTARPDGLEIQGDHRDRIEAHLLGQGLKVKRAGG
ncbi:MAG: translation initiation factor [Armatimonadetes bacterium]|nr:translation initiation factor [Armatimonadota bacterium]